MSFMRYANLTRHPRREIGESMIAHSAKVLKQPVHCAEACPYWTDCDFDHNPNKCLLDGIEHSDDENTARKP